MKRRLNLLETSWLALESAATPMHVGALLVFRKPVDADAGYVADLAARLRDVTPARAPWSIELERPWRGPIGARWVKSRMIDLDFHVCESMLPSPGGERELGELVSGLHGDPLDLARPLWECHLIDGLHDNQFAMYFKMHHALMDAASFIDLLTSTMGAAADQPVRPPWAAKGRSARIGGEELLQQVRGSLADPARVVETAREVRGALTRLWRAARHPQDDLRVPYTAPRSVLNGRIGPRRRFATQQYEPERLQAVAAACDVTLDELILYLCGSALRRFFKEYNALPDQPLLAALPAPRAGDAHLHGAMGIVSLATHHADPKRRLAEVRRTMRACAEHLQALPGSLLPTYTLAVATPYLAGQASGLTGLVPAMFNVVVSGLAGPDRPLYLGDARLAALYPMFPLVQGGALTIGVLRYAASVNVGFCGAEETLPGLQRMAVYMGLALEELEERAAAGEAHG